MLLSKIKIYEVDLAFDDKLSTLNLLEVTNTDVTYSSFDLLDTQLGDLIHLFNSLSYDRSKASSKASCPHSAIQSFLLQMRVSSPFLKVIQ